MSFVTRVEYSRLWLFGRLLIPARLRVRACIARGDHHLDLVDFGRSKACGFCGTGLPR